MPSEDDKGQHPSEALLTLEDHVRACFVHWAKADPEVRGLREGHIGELMSLFRNASRLSDAPPVPMFLTCPKCNARHIDEGTFATKPHHTHSCQLCGLTWRPTIGPTVGVAFLPGFKNEAEIEHICGDCQARWTGGNPPLDAPCGASQGIPSLHCWVLLQDHVTSLIGTGTQEASLQTTGTVVSSEEEG